VPCIIHDEKHTAASSATIRRATVPLRADRLNSVDLFNRPRFDVHGVVVMMVCFGPPDHGIGQSVIDVFAEQLMPNNSGG
jgi:hypothetical protein